MLEANKGGDRKVPLVDREGVVPAHTAVDQTIRGQGKREVITDVERDEESIQIVIAVGTTAYDLQTEIHFGRCQQPNLVTVGHR